MGGFFLFKNNSDLDIKSIKKIFIKKGFEEPILIKDYEYSILMFKKIKNPELNYYTSNNRSIYISGTLFYKGLSFKESAKQLFDDLIIDKVDSSVLFGNYFILFQNGGRSLFIVDPGNIYSIFYDTQKRFITSSFLAAITAVRSNLSINKNAATELLSTGSVIMPETLFNEVKRFDVNNPEKFGLMLNKHFNYNTNHRALPKGGEEAIEQQINILQNYQGLLADSINNLGIDIGLTGGYDSRLLFSIFSKYGKKVSIHSHYRSEYSKELESAKKVAEIAGFKLNVIKVKPPLEKDETEFNDTLEKSYLFCDGEIIADNYWIEDYNTLEYRQNVLGSNSIGMSGIGGEQYRSSERNSIYTNDLNDWIKYNMLYKQQANKFILNGEIENVAKGMVDKTLRMLKLTDSALSPLNLKRFMNEVYNPARRTVRASLENQLSYYLIPFAEYPVSISAYSAIPFLGKSNRFQEEMIRRTNIEIAKVESDYGYNFYEGTPIKKDLIVMISRLLPDNFFYNRIYSRKKTLNDDYMFKLESRFDSVKRYENNVEELELPIDLNLLKSNSILSPLLISLGFLMEKFL